MVCLKNYQMWAKYLLVFAIITSRVWAKLLITQGSIKGTIEDYSKENHLEIDRKILLSGQDSVYHGKRGVKTLENSTQEIVNSLDQYMKQLRSYISPRCFDYIQFQSNYRSLQVQISDLGHGIREMEGEDKQLLRQVKFLEQMLQAMNYASQSLKYFNRPKMEQCLVRHLIQLNLLLLTLHDSHGKPDPQIEGYHATVSRCIILLGRWSRMFKRLPSVEQTVEFMFESHHLRARRTLEFMVSDF